MLFLDSSNKQFFVGFQTGSIHLAKTFQVTVIFGTEIATNHHFDPEKRLTRFPNVGFADHRQSDFWHIILVFSFHFLKRGKSRLKHFIKII